MSLRVKILSVCACVWDALLGLFSCPWFGYTCRFVVRYGKGYTYNISSVSGVRGMFAFASVAVWIAAVVPITVWVCKRMRSVHPALIALPLGLFVAALVGGMFIYGPSELAASVGSAVALL